VRGFGTKIGKFQKKGVGSKQRKGFQKKGFQKKGLRFRTRRWILEQMDGV
jgi:hypothetical protein